MNGRVAMALRKKIYGDLSLKNPQYSLLQKVWQFVFPEKGCVLKSGQLVCLGPRAQYKAAKRDYMRHKNRKVQGARAQGAKT
jgi:hypothetical protein